MSKNTKSDKKKQAARKIEAALAAEPGDEIHVGIDVHKKNYHLAVRKNGALATTWVMPHDDAAVVQMLEPARPALRNVVYEAGPTGYSLARALEAAGFPVGVVAPNRTLREPQPGNKSDRLDCCKLAEHAAKDLLRFVTVPTEQEELDRQLVRTRDDIKQKRQRVMRQIRSLLLQYGIPEPEELDGKWTHAGIDVLRELELPRELRFRLDEYLAELAFHSDAMKRVEKELRRFEKEHTEEMDILKSHPGVGRVVARQFLAEVYRPGRFESGKEVAAYLGLAPRVNQSGETRREGKTLPGGRGALRAMLIEASWAMIGKDARAREVYTRLLHNTGNAKKAIHGVARKLAVRLWTMLVRKEAYRAAA